MTLLLLSYLGGVLTILSPCILPVLPFVFARSDQPFVNGIDIDSAGNGRVTTERLYQLIRQSGPVSDHTFEIEFLDPDVHAYAFAFG